MSQNWKTYWSQPFFLFIILSSMVATCLTRVHHLVPRHLRRHRTHCWRLPCAIPPEGMLFGLLAESSPFTGYEPKTCIDVSSKQTAINHTSRRNSFNVENNDLSSTVAASENTDGFSSPSGGQWKPAGQCQQVWQTHGFAPTWAPSAR